MMARDERLPMRAETMGSRLLNRALSSTGQLRAGTELSEDQAKRGMQDLKKRKLVTSVNYGCRLSYGSHHFFTEKGLSHFFAASDQQRSWHSQDAIGNFLVYDLPKVEAVHDIAPMFSTDGWPLAAIQFYERKALAAVAAVRPPGPLLPGVPGVLRALHDGQPVGAVQPSRTTPRRSCWRKPCIRRTGTFSPPGCPSWRTTRGARIRFSVWLALSCPGGCPLPTSRRGTTAWGQLVCL